MSLFKKFFKNKKIIITGHTGFKGSWLTLWCVILGAKVTGISNGITSNPSHYKSLNLKKKIKDINLDIRNLKKLKQIFKKTQPDYIFHLAAQSLVKKSYANPVETFTSNTIGTLNLLEALRSVNKRCHAVIITSDKSYKNLEIKKGYKENDLLGGDDPYSGSKGAAELIINSYFRSIISKRKNISITISRAGNVIGGGDWSADRIIPDCVKSWSKNKKAIIRNPHSTRPWQHVLEVIRGYFQSAILGKKNYRALNGEAFNFGPNNNQNKSVIQLVNLMKKNWSSVKWKIKKNNKNKESKLLKLNSTKAKKKLNWKPLLSFNEGVKLTADWYKMFYSRDYKTFELSKNQILNYENKIKKK